VNALNARRSAAIDGLRAFAAVSVVAYHSWLYTRSPVSVAHRDTLAGQMLHELRLGLVLFFVLSGFLLYQPWVRSALEGAAAPRLKDYLVRRAARILPAYYLAVAGSVALLWSLGDAPGVRLPPASGLWTFFVFGQNFSDATLLKLDPPLWTLAVEVSFYLALPALGWLALRLRHSGRAGQLAVPLAFLLFGFAYNHAIDGGAANWPTKILPAMGQYFAIGMIAAVLMHGRTLGRRMTAALFAGGALLVIGDAWWAADAATRGSHGVLLHVLRDAPAAAGFACVVGAAARTTRPPRLLAARPVAWAGHVSYGVYLWHVPLLLFLRARGALPLSTGGALVVIAPLAFAIASASWYGIERPVQERARRATRRGSRRPGTAVAGARAPAPSTGHAG
jgi:peptidoglycan/LPS O-acetylase OafA/YrhL